MDGDVHGGVDAMMRSVSSQITRKFSVSGPGDLSVRGKFVGITGCNLRQSRNAGQVWQIACLFLGVVNPQLNTVQ
jgi:hypothetical protein